MIVFAKRSDARRSAGLLLGFGALLALAACASEPETRPCPRAVVLSDAATQVKFNSFGRDLTDIYFEASIEVAGVACTYDDNTLDVDVNVRVTASRGPANSERLANINYFVAVSTTEPVVLARKSFDIAIPFPGNRTQITALEEIGQVIQLAPGTDGGNYRIYVGFDLTPEELEYNRANR